MKNKIIKSMMGIFLIGILTGCFDYQELNGMDFVLGIGIDYGNLEYEVSLEIVKAVSSEGSNEIDKEMVTGKGENLDEAFLNAKEKCDKEVFLEHVHLLVLSKELAMKGIKEELDYLIRDIDISTNYMTIVHDNPKDLLSVVLDDEAVSDMVVSTIKENIGSIENFTVDKIATLIINKQEDIVLPYIQMEDKNVIFENLMAFKEDIGIKTISKKMGIFLITNNTDVTFRNEKMTFSIYEKKISCDIKKDKVVINIEVLGNVKEITEEVDLKNGNNYKIYNEEIANTIYKEIKEYMDSTLKDKIDILGLGNKYYKKYGKEIDIDNLDYEIVVKAKLNKNGAIYEEI